MRGQIWNRLVAVSDLTESNYSCIISKIISKACDHEPVVTVCEDDDELSFLEHFKEFLVGSFVPPNTATSLGVTPSTSGTSAQVSEAGKSRGSILKTNE